ncbi:MAG: HPr family phosphocarrier protein [Peptoniphilus harei]|nr:HPr family phosphocarrier protein [Peptoniphilus harei]MDU3009330.1 HPr family phosphocarrier protein [Peptoniphilus harei]MDU7114438.1 HPr family phosphocarrier protein [Peptoniphilus harei]
MTSKKIVLNNNDGLHARAAALFVREANKFAADINLEAHGDKVNGKSIIGIMSLGAFSGEEVIIEAIGVDEEEAVERLSHIVEKEFINL